MRNAWHGVSDYEDLKDENERLRKRLEERDAADISGTDAERQLADLSLVLDLPYATDIPKVVARGVGPALRTSPTRSRSTRAPTTAWRWACR